MRAPAEIQRLFSILLLGGTLLPITFFSFFPAISSVPGTQEAKVLLLLLGAAHVPATLAFYLDPDFRRLSRDEPARYVWGPVALIIASAGLFAVAPLVLQGFLFAAFWLWQTWHYGRQNLGVYSFICLGTGGRTVRPSEKKLLMAGTIMGMFGILHVLAVGVLPAACAPMLRSAYGLGQLLSCLVCLALLWELLTVKPAPRLLGGISLVACTLFFLPMYLTTDLDGMFLSYAIAHAVQYFLFMSAASYGRLPEGATARRLAIVLQMFAIAILVGWASSTVMEQRPAEGVSQAASIVINLGIGAVLGLTMAHFVIDAGIWRLSRRPSRAFMQNRLGALLAKPVQTESPTGTQPVGSLSSIAPAQG